ncbi:hypothetical protein [Niabella beijingensis]|uniref:hypothetical protein n=1 Tax=Niabella beijingensis TaxID=2872700 RepID=UPI001CBE2301|nr:hypothetical protein [Niabella beijingensis]MBZ4192660.1 hypothetical protein [Niabella beijingensis]
MTLLTSRKTSIIILLIIIILYIIASFTLVGYYHPDEHFQILEFAQAKMGRLDRSGMAWEFHYAMRPSLQPWMVVGLQKVIGYSNPYTTALVLRLATALLSLWAILRFIRVVRPAFKGKWLIAFVLMSFLIWYLPYLNVRFSSETWSGLFFLLGLSYVAGAEKLSRVQALFCGLLLGIAFLCRYQVAIMIIGLLLWSVIIKKERISNILLVIAGCTFIAAIGVVMDYYFYGYWTLSVWNYYNMNIVHDRASAFGTTDSFSFLMQVIDAMTIPVGAVVLFTLLLIIIYRPRSFIVWIIMPFLVIHLIIPHKEVRFLFPLVNLTAYTIILGAQIIRERTKNINLRPRQSEVAKGVFAATIYVVILFNVACLTIAILSPPFYGRIAIANYIFNKYPKDNIELTGLRRSNVFNPYSIITQSFYQMDNVHFHPIASYDSLTNVAPLSTRSFFIVQRGDLKNPKVLDLLTAQNARPVKTIRPLWLTSLLDRFGMADRDFVLFGK